MWLLLICLLGILPFVSSCPKGLNASVLVQPKAPNRYMNRSKIKLCVHEWVWSKIPYCQCSGGPPRECCGHCPYCGSTRCDCSGYVANCWGLGGGYVTSNLPTVSHRIEKYQLKEGDILLNVKDHVVFFMGWTSAAMTHYHVFQEAGCHGSLPHHASKSITVYPMNWSPQLFKPYRYDYVYEDDEY